MGPGALWPERGAVQWPGLPSPPRRGRHVRPRPRDGLSPPRGPAATSGPAGTPRPRADQWRGRRRGHSCSGHLSVSPGPTGNREAFLSLPFRTAWLGTRVLPPRCPRRDTRACCKIGRRERGAAMMQRFCPGAKHLPWGDPAPGPHVPSRRARTARGGEPGLTPRLPHVQAHVLICTAMNRGRESTNREGREKEEGKEAQRDTGLGVGGLPENHWPPKLGGHLGFPLAPSLINCVTYIKS